MKRFAKKTALFLLPFVIIFSLFFAFEPYDYLGVKGSATYGSLPLSAMRRVMLTKPSRIILGDSRTANLNTDYIRELTGRDYTMLGFGGATLGECIELFWFAVEHTELEECVFGINFYSSGGPQGEGRIPAMEERAESVFRFIPHINYWLEAINAAKCSAKNLAAGLLSKPEWLEYPEDPTRFDPIELPCERGERYRLDLEEYSELIRKNLSPGYSVSDETYRKLFEVIDYCGENGIKLTFVFPPMHESMFDLAAQLGITDDIELLKSRLIERADVLDMQFLNDFTRDEDNFYDGFHLNPPKKRILAELIFTDAESGFIIRHRGEV